jgi:hypothetical protein
MNLFRFITFLIVFTLTSTIVWSDDEYNHKAHHPEAVSTTHNLTTKDTMMKMDSQLKSMREMHEKIMKTKTPEERKALMAEHLKIMQSGLSMMDAMSQEDDMPMMNCMSKHADHKDKMADMKDPMKCGMGDMATHHNMMKKRMQMMEAMMQMMMDRMAP